jgi:hypothetical protein
MPRRKKMENLNPLESTIIGILGGHKGQKNSVSRKDLVDRVNLHWPLFPVGERTVRRTIKHLIERDGFWIGSCPKGYFMVQTDEEFFKFRKYYRGYALSVLHTLAKIEKRSLPALLGQLSLEIGNSYDAIPR